MNKLLAIMTASAVLAGPTVPAHAQGQNPPPCKGAEYRQFDFWLGEWNVFTYQNGEPGAPQGQSRITKLFGDCGLQEDFMDAQGNVIGRSLNAVWMQDRQWHQTYVDAFGQVVMLAGSFQEGRMTLAGEYPSARQAALTIKQFVRWTPLKDDRVRQEWHLSSDGGKTWNVLFDGLYIRKK